MRFQALAAVVLASSSMLFLSACEETPAAGSASASSAPKPAPTPKPTPSATVSAAPSAEPVAPPRDDCPKDSKGGGTLTQPCEGSGANTRLLEAKWNNKIDDKGPSFNVTNKSGKVVNYGQVQIYFYDKAGKQLPLKDGAKTKVCKGANLFLGALKVDEKALIQFGCLKKDTVPEGTDAIEAEIDVVGFADKSDEKKVDLYWRNKDLTPEDRPKGGKK